MLPVLKATVAKCEELGLKYMFRTDGVIWPIADDIFVHAGSHGYGEIEYGAGMRLSEFKARYQKVACWGNVDTGGVLTLGSPEEVREATKRNIDEIREYGGHMLGSSNAIHKGVTAENFLAMVETAKEYGKGIFREFW